MIIDAFKYLATENRLKSMREVQGKTGPNYCLGSSKFFVGKLLGLFGQDKTWNDFMRSRWAMSHAGKIDLQAAWGRFRGARDFNEKVLPAAISDPSAHVAGPKNAFGTHVEFHSFTGNTAFADGLLFGRAPLVIGVDIHGTGARDHFITIVRDSSYHVWVVDSWGNGNDYSVAKLPSDFSFARPVEANLNASHGMTKIPCRTPWIGYYRDKKTKAALNLKGAI